MNDYSNFKSVIKQEQGNLDSNKVQTSNPLSMRTDVDSVALTEFSQETLRPKYDKDINDIIEVVRILNNMVPIRMPITILILMKLTETDITSLMERFCLCEKRILMSLGIIITQKHRLRMFQLEEF